MQLKGWLIFNLGHTGADCLRSEWELEGQTNCERQEDSVSQPFFCLVAPFNSYICILIQPRC